MNKCTNCGVEFEGKFCPECGTKWQDKRFCPDCGNELSATARFCPECGCSVSGAASKETKQETAATAATAPIQAETRTEPVQNAAPAQQYVQSSAPVKTASKADMMKTAHKVFKYVPAGLFALFSLLLFAFYAGSIAVVEGFDISLGNVYGDIIDNIPGMGGCIAALVIFLLASLTLTAFMALGLFHAKFKGKAVGLFGKAYLLLDELLNYMAFALYFIFFVISIVVMAKVSSADGGMGGISSGAGPKLILSFAIIFAVFSGAALVCDMLIGKKFPEIVEQEKRDRVAAIEACKAAEEAKRAQKEQEAARLAENAQAQSAKTVLQTDSADDTPICLAGKPVLKKVSTYIRFRRVLKGMGIASLVLSYLILLCLAAIFGIGIPKEIIFYFALGAFGLFALLGILCSLPSVKHWAPSQLVKRSAVSGGNSGAGGMYIASFIANALCIMVFAIIINVALDEEDLDLLFIPITVLMGMFAVFNLMGIIASSAVKSRYKELAKHFYGTTKPYSDTRAVLQYNPEKETAFYAAYKKNKSVVAGYANGATPTKTCAVRGVISTVFAAVAIACLIAFQFVLSPFSVGYVSLLSNKYWIYEDGLAAFLGTPDLYEGNRAVYYGGEFKSVYNELKDIEEEMEEAFFNMDLSKLASLEAKAQTLEAKMENMVFPSLVITFDDNHYISRVRLDTRTNAKEEFATKVAEKVEIADGVRILRGYAGGGEIYGKYYYTDGSYKYEPLPSSIFAQLDSEKTSPQLVEWEDEWGSYSMSVKTVDSISGEYKNVKYTIARNERTGGLSAKLSGKTSAYFGSDEKFPWSMYAPYVTELTYSVQNEYSYSNHENMIKSFANVRSLIISKSVTELNVSDLRELKSLTDVWAEATSAPSGWRNFSNSGEWESAHIHWGNEWSYVGGVPTLKYVSSSDVNGQYESVIVDKENVYSATILLELNSGYAYITVTVADEYGEEPLELNGTYIVSGTKITAAIDSLGVFTGVYDSGTITVTMEEYGNLVFTRK